MIVARDRTTCGHRKIFPHHAKIIWRAAPSTLCSAHVSHRLSRIFAEHHARWSSRLEQRANQIPDVLSSDPRELLECLGTGGRR
jgi:hypothetical protein